ncbi:MAG: glycosyltransferase family 2 protein [Clostridiales bacterium]|nr:glycosyltransferase family 2 protein [Clostridiales bacterium]
MNTSIDIIVPCYNEEPGLNYFYTETRKVLDTIENYRFRFLFINDGSQDQTLRELRRLAALHSDVWYLSFSRNFGKEAAMYAGLKHTDSDLVIIMDADLQHPPSMIPSMLKGIEEGYDCAAARRTSRAGESKIRSFFSSMFYRLSNRMTDVQMAQGAVDFRVMTRQMVNAILQLSEVERFSKGIFSWVGFRTKWYPYENVERVIGTTKWSFWGLFRYAISGITSFSIAPLRMVAVTGFIISLAAFLYIIFTLIKTLMFGIDVPGYVTILCAVLFLGGIIELSIGILGEYISHIYLEAKDRPVYIIQESHLEQNSSDSVPDTHHKE